MGLGKITRGLGKIGLAFEALGYVIAGGKALAKAVRGRSEKADDTLPDASDRGDSEQGEFDRQ